MISTVPLADALTTDLPQDPPDPEAVAASTETEELKTLTKERRPKELTKLFAL